MLRLGRQIVVSILVLGISLGYCVLISGFTQLAPGIKTLNHSESGIVSFEVEETVEKERSLKNWIEPIWTALGSWLFVPDRVRVPSGIISMPSLISAQFLFRIPLILLNIPPPFLA